MRVACLGQQGAANDDFATCFASAFVDRPERFKPFDARLQHVETLGVILDIFKRGDVPLLMDSVLARLSQRRLQLPQTLDEGGFLIGPFSPFAVA